MNEVVHEFNYFFVNVGPNLAKTIPKQHDGQNCLFKNVIILLKK